MIRFAGWPVGTAAAFVTAVAVVLNPITPVLPDITVPALLPPASQSPPRAQAAPHQPAIAKPAPAAAPSLAAPILAAPPVAAQPYPGRPFIPVQAPAPAAAPAPALEFPSFPSELPEIVPPPVPAVKVATPLIAMQHTGDRPRTAAPRQTFAAPVSGARPLPAAAVGAQGSPELDDPAADDGAVRHRARGQSAPPDPADTAPRHRGATDRG